TPPALAAAKSPPDVAPADGAAADLRRALTSRGIALAIDRFRLQRQPRAIGQDDRRELHAKARAVAHLSAALDQSHFAKCFRAGWNRDTIAHFDITCDASGDAVLDLCLLAGHRRLELQSDHRVSSDDELVVDRTGRVHRSGGLVVADGSRRDRDSRS